MLRVPARRLPGGRGAGLGARGAGGALRGGAAGARGDPAPGRARLRNAPLAASGKRGILVHNVRYNSAVF